MAKRRRSERVRVHHRETDIARIRYAVHSGETIWERNGPLTDLMAHPMLKTDRNLVVCPFHYSEQHNDAAYVVSYE